MGSSKPEIIALPGRTSSRGESSRTGTARIAGSKEELWSQVHEHAARGQLEECSGPFSRMYRSRKLQEFKGSIFGKIVIDHLDGPGISQAILEWDPAYSYLGRGSTFKVYEVVYNGRPAVMKQAALKSPEKTAQVVERFCNEIRLFMGPLQHLQGPVVPRMYVGGFSSGADVPRRALSWSYWNL